MLSVRADELEEAAQIIRSQLHHQNHLWLNSMITRNIGGDVGLLVKDVRHVETTGRNRETTWPRHGDRDAARRERNTKGYQVQSDIPSASYNAPH
jgi:hypothetical protein